MQEDVEVKYNYPGNLPLPTTRDKRLVFEGYGSYGGFLVQESEIHFQRSPVQPRECRLKPDGPTLPLFLPNETLTIQEPCVADILRQRKELSSYMRHFNAIKGQLLKDEERLSSLHTFTRDWRHAKSEPRRKSDVNDPPPEATAPPTDVTITSQLMEMLETAMEKGMSRQAPSWIRKLYDHYSDVRQQPVPKKLNKWFGGGALSYWTEGDDVTLVFPSGSNLSSLTHQSVRRDECDMVQHPGSSTTLSDLIFQVTCCETQGRKVGAARLKNEILHFEKLEDNVELLGSSLLGKHYTSVHLSFVCDEKGTVLLWDLHQRDRIASTCVELAESQWCSAHSAAHPRQVALSTADTFSVWDTRQSAVSTILTLPLPAINAHEEIRAAILYPEASGFYHLLATDNYLMLVDLRFPGNPVLLWSHSLRSPPAYIDVVKSPLIMTESDVILLAAQEHAEVHGYMVDLHLGLKWPPSTSGAPWLIDPVRNLRQLPLVGCHSPAVMRRLEAPLVGVVSVTKSSSTGFNAVQSLTQAKEADESPRFDQLQYSNEQLQSCTKWINKVRSQVRIPRTPSKQKRNSVGLGSSLWKDMTQFVFPHGSCPLCLGIVEPVSQVDDDVTCPACRTPLSMGKQLAHEEFRIIPLRQEDSDESEWSTSFDQLKPEDYTDVNSRLLFSQWNGGPLAQLLEERDTEVEELHLKVRQRILAAQTPDKKDDDEEEEEFMSSSDWDQSDTESLSRAVQLLHATDGPKRRSSTASSTAGFMSTPVLPRATPPPSRVTSSPSPAVCQVLFPSTSPERAGSPILLTSPLTQSPRNQPPLSQLSRKRKRIVTGF